MKTDLTAVSQKKKNTKYSPFLWTAQMITAKVAIEPFHFFYSRFHATGRENIHGKGPFLVVSNHLSYFDPPLLVVSTQIPMAFIAKTELFDVRGLKELIKFYGAIPINRGKPSLSSIRAVKQVFQAGWSVGIFIEGTRNKTPGVLGQPHEGPAYFAWSNQVPIIPLGLLGTNKRFGKAEGHIGKIIQPSEDLQKTTWEIMESLSQLTGYAMPERKLDHQI
jgi:1-acyl-sn-glycerol-3-phosphate acyltransferase